MGKGSKPTIGFWYHVAYHHGITTGPIDAFLEYRGGDKIAWQGELTESGTIQINANNLWGGEKDQGGIEGPLAVMFGEPSQLPHPYLVSTFGPKTASWRGFTTVAFLGGLYGAMNPYPKPPSYKFRRIFNGWDGDCWYPEKASIAIQTGKVFISDLAFPATSAALGPYAGVTIDSGFSASDVLIIEKLPGMTYRAWSQWSSDSDSEANGMPWNNRFSVTNNTTGVTTLYWDGHYQTIEAAEAAVLGKYVVLSGGASYTIWLHDTPVSDNRGGLSVKVWKGGSFGINPAHVLYDSRTNADMGREITSSINDASLRAAADKLYDEGFGICPKWNPASEPVEDFEKRICKLIGGSFNRSLEDGQWYLDLARGDYNIDDLPILTDDDILDFKEQPSILDNAVNSVSASYFDPDRKETIVTPPVRALGLVASYGTIHQTNEYPEIPMGTLATRVAQRDMLSTATPTRAFDLVTTRKTYAWRPNQYFRLQAPKRGIADMVCIVGERQSGTLKSGAIRMKSAQDIYSMPATSFVAVEPGVDTRPLQTPSAIILQRALEAPYVEAASRMPSAELAALEGDAAYVLAMAVDPARTLDFTMQTAPHASSAFVDVGNGEWCPSALVVEGDALAGEAPATSFTLAGGDRLDNVAVGSAALWEDEIVRVDAIDTSADPAALTLGRGCADTVSAPHTAGSRIYFYGDTPAYDPTQFTAGESVDVRLLTNTGSAQLDPDLAATETVALAGRLMLPYPPAKLRIAGNPYPATVAGEFAVTWAHRNRTTQADMLVDDTAASIAPAANTRYGLRFLDASDALLIERTDIGPATASVALNYTGDVTMELYTIDAIGLSMQRHRITFDYTPPSGTVVNAITAVAYTPVYDGIIVDGGA